MTVPTSSIVEISPVEAINAQRQPVPHTVAGIEVGLLTACRDRHYAFALAMALISKGICLDFVGGDEIDSPELHTAPNLRFLSFRRDPRENAAFAQKLAELLLYYSRLIRYAARSSPEILHILWNGKLELFDRTILMLYYKARGKKIAFTAHNVNGARRDSKDSLLNRITLGIQYRLCDHIFVHTEKMKNELCREFNVGEDVVTVIRYPINNAIPDTALTPVEAKKLLGLRVDERVILFFGKIRPYKGIDQLIAAFIQLFADGPVKYRMIIAGEPTKDAQTYVRTLQHAVDSICSPNQVILRFQFIPDEDLELYFKGSDVLVLPYREIFQSGVLFLAYSFGLPVVATDVGSLRGDIVEGKTGFLCSPDDPADLARAVRTYFASELFKNLREHRREIKEYANTTHSWNAAAELTCNAYAKMLARN
jgi:glycosyltransferase involved in cell wall biosynthesis